MMEYLSRGVALAAVLSMAMPAHAQSTTPQIVIGAVVSVTGPASSLGVPEKMAIELAAALAAKSTDLGFTAKVVIYDDASDPSRAVNSTRKLIGEDQAAVVICCTTTPASMAVLDTVKEAGVLNISMASAATVIEPVGERFWTFKTPMTDRSQIGVVLDAMLASGAKRVAFFGLEDAYGEAGWNEFRQLAEKKGLEIVASERFARADTNFTPQALRIRQGQPDAVYIHSIPPSSVLAHQALAKVGFDKSIYHGCGSANGGILKVGKSTVDGAVVVSGALQVADQLPVDHPLKATLLDFASAFDNHFPGQKAGLFAGQGWDAAQLSLRSIDAALQSGGDPKDIDTFRKSVRDRMEQSTGYKGANGIFNFSASDHGGLDSTGIVMLRVVDGQFLLLSE